jgi:hypothetical protein
MGDKEHMHEMDEEMVAKWTKMITELGVPEEQVDEHLIWVFKKATHKLSKLRLVLDEKGVDEATTKAIVEKLAAHVNGKDLAKIKEWKEKYQEQREKND